MFSAIDFPSFLPNSQFCEILARSFFPGRSFFFWLLIALGFYLAYHYSVSKNKKDFFKSAHNLSLSIALGLFFITYLTANFFFPEPIKNQEIYSESKKVNQLLEEEKDLLSKVEKNFTDPLIHEEYINKHFEIPSTWIREDGYNTERDDYTIFNFYRDKVYTLDDSAYLNSARLGLGILYYHQNELDSAVYYLKSISVEKFPLVNSFLGNIALDLQDTTEAIKQFKLASLVKDNHQKESGENLVHLLDAQNKREDLLTLLYQDHYKAYFSYSLASRLYFEYDKVLDYYILAIKTSFSNFKWTGFIAAFVIMMVWGIYIVRMDFFEQEHAIVIFLVLLGGMISALVCFYLYDYMEYKWDFYLSHDNLLLYSIFGIGLIEEFVKIVPLILILIVAGKVVDEPYDYILFAAISALGFSFTENLMYFDGDLNSVIHGRALTSVPGHIIDSSIVAYGFVLARYRYRNNFSWLFIPLFFFLGILNHGLYDYFAFNNNIMLFIIFFLLSVSFWIIMVNNCLNNSPTFNYRIASKPHSIQLLISLSLLGILIMEYLIVAWENGPIYANSNFNGHIIFGGIMITYYSNRLTSIDLVRGYWGGIPFKTINEKRSDAEFNLKDFVIRVFSGDTFTHSFVNHEVILQARPENEKLYFYFNTSVKGMINDRLVVTCKSSKGVQYEDPFWFRLETQHPIEVGGGMERTFLFRFEEVRPSFNKSDKLIIYLFVPKTGDDLMGKMGRENLRSLGRAEIRKME